MKKDAFYFPHFCNARHDRKIRRMEKELGLESYAIYFKLLEILREQIDFRYPLEDIDLLADEIGTTEPKVKVVISGYELFNIDEDNKFFSIKQIYYLQPYLEKTERARLAAQKRWSGVVDANAMQMQCTSNADAMQVKESKVKESKVNKVFIKPTLNEFIEYGLSLGSDEPTISKIYKSYDVADWHDAQGKKIKNWKQKLINRLQYNFKGNNNQTKPNDKLTQYTDWYKNGLDFLENNTSQTITKTKQIRS